MGFVTDLPLSVFEEFFPSKLCIYPIHPYHEHATHIFYWSAIHHVLGRGYSRSKQKINSATTSWCKLNWPFGTSVNIRTCASGPQSLFLSVVLIIDASNLCSSNGPRVATSIELPVCLSIFPSPERALEEICHEHQCPSWACYTLATCQTQIHTSSRQRYPFLRTVPKPS